MRLTVAIALLFVGLGLSAGEMDIAREALRDGLWQIARIHALRAEEPDAKAVVLESIAREGRWEALLSEAGGAETPASDLVRYYRALALVELNRLDEAEAIVAAGATEDAWRLQFLRLRARIAKDKGDLPAAVEFLEASVGDGPIDVADMLALADLKSDLGDRAGAIELWRRIVADTNVTDFAYASAALGLGDEATLTNAFARAPGMALTRRVGLRLGRKWIAEKDKFSEGERLIRRMVKDAPDGEDARASFVALGEAYLSAQEWKSASALIREAFEIWPDSVRSPRLQFDLGWALDGEGRYDEAYAAMVRAESLGGDEKLRSEAGVRQGDLLEKLGRGDEALEKYRKVRDDYPESSVVKRLEKVIRVRELERKAREQYADFDFAGAQAGFAAVAKSDPERASRMAFYEVLCLYGRGHDDEAENRAMSLVESATDAVTRNEAVLWLAKLAYNRGKWNDSARLFVRFAADSPDSPEASEALLWSARAAAASGDWQQAVSNVTRLVEHYPETPLLASALLVQARVLTELARFDEAVLVVDRALSVSGLAAAERRQARMIRSDALFAMGADNPLRYQESLAGYRDLRLEPDQSASSRVVLSYRIAKCLEKLRQVDDALDAYYTDVILFYRNGRLSGERFDDEACAAFSRAALRVADEFESRGRVGQAVQVLRLLATSDVPAADEAVRRISRIESKGRLL